MVIIKNCYFYTSYEDIINNFKTYMLKVYGIEVFRKSFKSGNDIMCCCPFHSEGNERKPSFGINIDEGFYHCFTCGEKGTFEALINNIFKKYNINDTAIDYLNRTYQQSKNLLSHLEITKKEYKKPVTIQKYDYFNPTYTEEGKNYLKSRGISFYNAYNNMISADNDYVYFRVHDFDGNYVYTTKRSINTKFFYIEKEVEKEVYLSHRQKYASQVAICESQFNALSFIEHGIAAVALFGTGTDYQYEILKRFEAKKFIIALDGDIAGHKGTLKLYSKLKDKYELVVANCPQGLDINDCHTQNRFEDIKYTRGIV